MKNYKNLFLLILLATILFFPLNQALALELTYPVLPGAPDINTNPSVEGFISYFFVFSVILAGSIAMVSIAIAGVQILLTAGNPGGRSAAIERIRGSILGLILLMTSVIILQTINPALVNVTAPHFSSYLKDGVYYIKPSTMEVLPAPSSASSRDEIPTGFNDLIYKCTQPNGPKLLVWLYERDDFLRASSDSGDTVSIDCGDFTPVSLASFSSFRQHKETTGIYYYRKDDCTGLASCDLSGNGCAQITDGDIPNFDSDETLNNRVNSFKIVNGDELNRFVAILTKSYGLQGECSEPYINSTDSSICVGGAGATVTLNKDLDGNDFNPYAIHILKQATWYPNTHNVSFISDHLRSTIKESNIGSPGHYTYPETAPTPPTVTGFSCNSSTNACEADPQGTATGCTAGNPPTGTCAPATGPSSNLDNLLSDPPDDVDHGTWSQNDAPANECTDAETDPVGNRKVCVNRIESLSNFNVILYATPQKPGQGERGCSVFSNGMDNTDSNNPDQQFIDLVGYSEDKKTFRDYIYRMDIIPYPY